MQILFYYEQRGYGGVDTHMAHLINNWPNSKDSFIVLSNPDNIGLKFFKQQLIVNNVNIVLIENVFRELENKPFKWFFYLLTHLKFILKFNSYLKDLRPDLLIVNNGGFPGGMTCWIAAIIGQISKITRRKTFFLIHHAPANSRNFFKFYANFLAEFFTWFNIPSITVSFASKKALEENTRLKKIKVIYNGLEINQNFEEKFDFFDKFNISKEKVIIGMIGSIDSHKGHETIINAIKLSHKLQKKAHIVFVGSGDESFVKGLKKKAKEFDIEDLVTFTGFLPDSSSKIVSGFDILVMPTIDFEGFGYSIAEAMLQSVAVIASNVGAIPEVIEKNKNGLLVEPLDLYGWCNNIEKLVSDKSLRLKIGRLGRERILKKFSAATMSELYYSFMKDSQSDNQVKLNEQKF